MIFTAKGVFVEIVISRHLSPQARDMNMIVAYKFFIARLNWKASQRVSRTRYA